MRTEILQVVQYIDINFSHIAPWHIDDVTAWRGQMTCYLQTITTGRHLFVIVIGIEVPRVA